MLAGKLHIAFMTMHGLAIVSMDVPLPGAGIKNPRPPAEDIIMASVKPSMDMLDVDVPSAVCMHAQSEMDMDACHNYANALHQVLRYKVKCAGIAMPSRCRICRCLLPSLHPLSYGLSLSLLIASSSELASQYAKKLIPLTSTMPFVHL